MAGTQSQMGFGGSPVPRKVTIITSGTGTFTPLAESTWRRERLVSAGGGGGAGNTGSSGGSGQSGALSERWVKNDGLPKSYAVGAPGPAGTSGLGGGDGGDTTLGATTVPGGHGGLAGPASGAYIAAPRGGPSPFGGYGRGGDAGVSTTAGTAGTGGVIEIEEF